MNLGKDKAAPRKTSHAEQMALAKLFDGKFNDLPGGRPALVEAHAAYAPFADSDALQVLLDKNIFANFGDEGYARGWKWDSYVNSVFTEDEKPPVASK